MLKEFREFISRGNVIDLAVAVIVGAAFTGIVTSLVDDIMTPILGIFLGGVNFSALSIDMGEASVNYGNFIQAVINFLIVAWVIFIIVRSINQLQRRFSQAKEKASPEPSEEVKLLTEIRNFLQADRVKMW